MKNHAAAVGMMCGGGIGAVVVVCVVCLAYKLPLWHT